MNINPEILVIGVDLGGTTTAAALVDANLNLLDQIEIQTDTSSQSALLESIAGLVGDLSAKAAGRVAAVGFGIPSMIDQTRGRAIMSVNVPLADFDFVDHMSARLSLPVFIDNDANLAALAETRAGAARGASEVIMITMGTGIGGGIIINGRVYRGYTGSAAELGHMVIDVNGPRCQGSCENYGCFETMASGTALKRYAAEAAAEKPESELGKAAANGVLLDGAMVTSLAQGGDEAALLVLKKIGFYLGVGMTSLVNMFNPEVFVVGGGLAKAGDLILKPAMEILHERGLRPNRDIVRVVTATFGPDAGIMGAACLALDAIIEKPRDNSEGRDNA
ncbi:MAG: ROK family protein [Thermoleophilia bacterium]